jgi:ABC-type multidrug transport system fused ATPase/permease subunit
VPTHAEGAGEREASITKIVKVMWSCFQATTRHKLIVSGVLAAALAALDAVAVGLIPLLIHRFEGKSGGLFAGTSTTELGAFVVALLITKTLCGAVLLWWQSSFIAYDESERTIELFHHFFHRPYGDTAGINTNQFVRDLQFAVPQLYRGAGAGLGQLIADGLGLAGLIAIVLFTSPLTGVVLFVFLVFAAQLYARLIRSRVGRLSTRQHAETNDCLKDLNESFGGLKTLKAFSAENVAIGRFTDTRNTFALSARDLLFYTQVSRYYLEVALVVGLGACMGVAYTVNGSGAVLALFGLLSGVAARAMPALARCLYSVTAIKVAGAWIFGLEPDLRRLEEPSASHETTGPEHNEAPAVSIASDDRPRLVALDRVSFRYPRGTEEAVRDVSLDVRPGEMVTILGESGAGKTTLVDVLIGLLSPDRGEVWRPPGTSFGYVAQETFVWDDSVRFNVTLDRPPAAGSVEDEIWHSLEAARLSDWVRGLPEALETELGERGSRMSGGQRQRLGLARALYAHPTVLVLDEPTSALDSETSRALLATLVSVKSDVGILVVTHDPIVMEYSDRTITLSATGRPMRATG